MTYERHYGLSMVITQRGNMVHAPTHFTFEIHSRSVFKQSWRKRIKALGGSYSDTRGNVSYRYVTLPNTDEGHELFTEVTSDDDVSSTMSGGVYSFIFAGDKISDDCASWIHVQCGQSIDDALRHYQAAVQQAIDRGYLKREDRADYETRKAREVAQERRETAQRIKGAIERLLADASAFAGVDADDIDTLLETLGNIADERNPV